METGHELSSAFFGNTLASHTIERQITEARIKTAALNRMTQLGMPDTYHVA